MEKIESLIGTYAPDFELPGTDDGVHHLAPYLERFQTIGVVFMCNHCPYVQMYLDRLKQIQAEFQSPKFTLVGINPNDAEQFPEDSFENMKTFATERQLNFPYLRDVAQDVARAFGATKTPQAFLVDQAGKIRYGGGIDDQPQAPSTVRSHYLRQAITQLLQGEPIAAPITEVVGCSVKWRR